jgi:hypothetical protein
MGWFYAERRIAQRAAKVLRTAKRHRAKRECLRVTALLGNLSINETRVPTTAAAGCTEKDWYWSEHRCAQRAAVVERKASRYRELGYPGFLKRRQERAEARLAAKSARQSASAIVVFKLISRSARLIVATDASVIASRAPASTPPTSRRPSRAQGHLGGAINHARNVGPSQAITQHTTRRSVVLIDRRELARGVGTRQLIRHCRKSNMLFKIRT